MDTLVLFVLFPVSLSWTPIFSTLVQSFFFIA